MASFWKGLLSVLTGGVSNALPNLGDILNNAGEAARDVGTQNLLGNYMAKTTGSRLTDAEREANAFTAEREDIAWQRELEASNTAVQRRVADMQAAGVNPMMAVSGAGGASQPSANVSGSVSPSGGPNLGSLIQSALQSKLIGSQVANIDADTALKKADAAKKAEETTGVGLDNEYKQRIMDARLEAQNLANDLSRARVHEIDAQIEELSARTKGEEARAFYDRANAYKITQLLPYEKLFMQASTESQKAAAAFSMVNAAYQQKLIDSGYIDAMFEKMKAETRDINVKADISQLQLAIKNGNYGSVINSKAFDGSVIGAAEGIMNNVIATAANLASFITPFK